MTHLYYITEEKDIVEIADIEINISTGYSIVKTYIDSSGNINHPSFNFLPDVYFNSYEECRKMLTKLLTIRCKVDYDVKLSLEDLIKDYPEYAI